MAGPLDNLHQIVYDVREVGAEGEGEAEGGGMTERLNDQGKQELGANGATWSAVSEIKPIGARIYFDDGTTSHAICDIDFDDDGPMVIRVDEDGKIVLEEEP